MLESKKEEIRKMNKELMGALDELEREKNISKETLLDAIEQSLIQAYKNHFGKACQNVLRATLTGTLCSA